MRVAPQIDAITHDRTHLNQLDTADFSNRMEEYFIYLEPTFGPDRDDEVLFASTDVFVGAGMDLDRLPGYVQERVAVLSLIEVWHYLPGVGVRGPNGTFVVEGRP